MCEKKSGQEKVSVSPFISLPIHQRTAVAERCKPQTKTAMVVETRVDVKGRV